MTEAEFIKSFVKKLHKRNPIRRIATQVLIEDMVITPMDVELLAESLGHNNESKWRERTIAAFLLGNCDLEGEQLADVEAILKRIVTCSDISFTRRMAQRTSHAFIIWLISLIILVGLELMSIPLRHINLDGLVTLIFIMVYGVVIYWPIWFPLFLMNRANQNKQLRVMCTIALGNLGKQSCVGALAQAAYETGFNKVNLTAIHSLRFVLPTITEEHYGQLGDNATPSLCRLLDRADDRFTVMVLNALGKAGGGSAVDSVKRVADKATAPEVRAVALTALAALEERRRNEDAQRLLLRPSAAPAENTLLRPAANAPSDDPALLLRPSERNSD